MNHRDNRRGSFVTNSRDLATEASGGSPVRYVVKRKNVVPGIFHCLRVLAIFNKLFVKNLRFRDRTVKIVQYGSQCLSGYFSSYFSREVNIGLINTRRAASTARKWFWLVKMGQHLIWVLNNSNSKVVSSLLGKIDYFEQVFLVAYYVYENLILGARMKLPGFHCSRDEFGTNLTWFLSDIPLLISSCIRLHYNLREIRDTKKKVNMLKQNLTIPLTKGLPELEFNSAPLQALENLWITIVENIYSGCTGTELEPVTITNDKGSKAAAELQQLQSRMKKLMDERGSKYLQTWIAVLEVGVSAHYCGLYKTLVESHGKFMGNDSKYAMTDMDGPVGLMGVISSSLIMFQYWSHLPPDNLMRE